MGLAGQVRVHKGSWFSAQSLWRPPEAPHTAFSLLAGSGVEATWPGHRRDVLPGEVGARQGRSVTPLSIPSQTCPAVPSFSPHNFPNERCLSSRAEPHLAVPCIHKSPCCHHWAGGGAVGGVGLNNPIFCHPPPPLSPHHPGTGSRVHTKCHLFHLPEDLSLDMPSSGFLKTTESPYTWSHTHTSSHQSTLAMSTRPDAKALPSRTSRS